MTTCLERGEIRSFCSHPREGLETRIKVLADGIVLRDTQQVEFDRSWGLFCCVGKVEGQVKSAPHVSG